MHHITAFFTLLTLLTPITVVAVDAGSVDSLQMPVWLERDGSKQALRVGTILRSDDVLITGGNARLLVILEEGSSVKLGENGKLNLITLKAPDKKEGVFEGLMNVLKGAFRFTTSIIDSNRKRDITVRIGVITAGIRGTDIWGSAKIDKDILCLIEGNITAKRDGEAEFTMDEPLSFYIVPKDKPALPVQPVPEAKLAKWALETDLQIGGGIIRAEGEWVSNLASLSSYQSAETFQQLLESAGYAADITTKEINDQQWHRVRIEGFVSENDARSFSSVIDGQMGINQAWVEKI